MISERFLLPGVLVALTFGLLRWMAGRRFLYRTPADLGVLLLAFTIPVSLWATALPEITIPQVLRLLMGIALFYAIGAWAAHTARVRWLASGLVLAGVGLAGLALVSVDWDVNKLPFIPAGIYALFPRLIQDSVHRNVMAGSLVLCLPLTIAPWLKPKDYPWIEKAFLAVAGLFMAAVLILTQSRGGLLGFTAACFGMAFIRWPKIGAIAGTLVLLLAVLLASFGIYQFSDILQAFNQTDTAGVRLEIWSRAIYIIQDFPFTGTGMGSFQKVVENLYPLFESPIEAAPHAHNLFLQIAADLGIPGLIGWLAVSLSMLYTTVKGYLRPKPVRKAWMNGLFLGLFGSQIALLVHGMVDAVTWGMVKPAPLVWAIWGIAAAGWLVYKKDRP